MNESGDGRDRMAPPGAGHDVVAVLLAGGRSRRMGGGPKCLMRLAGRPLIEWVRDRIGGQVATMVLSTSAADAWALDCRLPVVTDGIGGFAGPLAGIAAAMTWGLEHAPERAWIATVPTDTPFLPADLIARLLSAAERAGGDVACAASGGRLHPVCGLWRMTLAKELRTAVIDGGLRRVEAALNLFAHGIAEYPVDPFDPFLNINTPADLLQAEAIVAAGAVRPESHQARIAKGRS